MQDVLVAVTVIVVGLLVGVELAVAAVANPIFDRLPGDSGLVARSSAARMLGRVMPFWYVGSVVLAGLWAAEMWGSALASIVMAAAALLLTSVVMSVVLLVPINSRVARWSRGAPLRTGGPKSAGGTASTTSGSASSSLRSLCLSWLASRHEITTLVVRQDHTPFSRSRSDPPAAQIPVTRRAP